SSILEPILAPGVASEHIQPEGGTDSRAEEGSCHRRVSVARDSRWSSSLPSTTGLTLSRSRGRSLKVERSSRPQTVSVSLPTRFPLVSDDTHPTFTPPGSTRNVSYADGDAYFDVVLNHANGVVGLSGWLDAN